MNTEIIGDYYYLEFSRHVEFSVLFTIVISEHVKIDILNHVKIRRD